MSCSHVILNIIVHIYVIVIIQNKITWSLHVKFLFYHDISEKNHVDFFFIEFQIIAYFYFYFYFISS